MLLPALAMEAEWPRQLAGLVYDSAGRRQRQNHKHMPLDVMKYNDVHR